MKPSAEWSQLESADDWGCLIGGGEDQDEEKAAFGRREREQRHESRLASAQSDSRPLGLKRLV